MKILSHYVLVRICMRCVCCVKIKGEGNVLQILDSRGKERGKCIVWRCVCRKGSLFFYSPTLRSVPNLLSCFALIKVCSFVSHFLWFSILTILFVLFFFAVVSYLLYRMFENLRICIVQCDCMCQKKQLFSLENCI